jgi:hypothetical protein
MEDKSFAKSSLKDKMGMMKNFASAIVSRGVNNKKIDEATKQLRVLSCFGNDDELIPCEYLRDSKTAGKNYCGGCGCGDRKGTWLMSDGDEYSKLDYPKLYCPLNMPGFANYKSAEDDEGGDTPTRRFYIENMKPEDIRNIEVSLPDSPDPPKEPTPKDKKE